MSSWLTKRRSTRRPELLSTARHRRSFLAGYGRRRLGAGGLAQALPDGTGERDRQHLRSGQRRPTPATRPSAARSIAARTSARPERSSADGGGPTGRATAAPTGSPARATTSTARPSAASCNNGCDPFCSQSCWNCQPHAASGTCDARRVCWNVFRYGQCNSAAQVRRAGGLPGGHLRAALSALPVLRHHHAV